MDAAALEEAIDAANIYALDNGKARAFEYLKGYLSVMVDVSDKEIA